MDESWRHPSHSSGSINYFHPTAWPTDNILAAGQRLLQRQTGTRGLQPPCLGQACAFNVQKREFIQIISNGYDYWDRLTISTVGAAHGTVNIYDSLHMSVILRLTEQVASCMHWQIWDHAELHWRSSAEGNVWLWLLCLGIYHVWHMDACQKNNNSTKEEWQTTCTTAKKWWADNIFHC